MVGLGVAWHSAKSDATATGLVLRLALVDIAENFLYSRPFSNGRSSWLKAPASRHVPTARPTMKFLIGHSKTYQNIVNENVTGKNVVVF